jgi:hypothetical protein
VIIANSKYLITGQLLPEIARGVEHLDGYPRGAGRSFRKVTETRKGHETGVILNIRPDGLSVSAP